MKELQKEKTQTIDDSDEDEMRAGLQALLGAVEAAVAAAPVDAAATEKLTEAIRKAKTLSRSPKKEQQERGGDVPATAFDTQGDDMEDDRKEEEQASGQTTPRVRRNPEDDSPPLSPAMQELKRVLGEDTERMEAAMTAVADAKRRKCADP